MAWYSVKDVAEILSVNAETVRRWIRSGKLIKEKEGRFKNKISENSLNEFIHFHRSEQYQINQTQDHLGLEPQSNALGNSFDDIDELLKYFNDRMGLPNSGKANAVVEFKEMFDSLSYLLFKQIELEKKATKYHIEIERLKKEVDLIEKQLKTIYLVTKKYLGSPVIRVW